MWNILIFQDAKILGEHFTECLLKLNMYILFTMQYGRVHPVPATQEYFIYLSLHSLQK